MLRPNRLQLLPLGLAAISSALALAGDTSGSGPTGSDAKGTKSKVQIVTINKDGDSEPEVRVLTGDGSADELRAQEMLEEVFAAGKKRGYLGISMVEVGDELSKYLGAASVGVLISHVEAGSPADKAGLKVGDLLTSVGGQAVESSFDVSRSISGGKQGDSVEIEFVRERHEKSTTATLDEKERAVFDMAPFIFHAPKGSEAWAYKFDSQAHLPEDMTVHVDPQALAKMSEQIQKELSSQDFKKQLEAARTAEQRIKELEVQLKELAERLKSLEKK